MLFQNGSFQYHLLQLLLGCVLLGLVSCSSSERKVIYCFNSLKLIYNRMVKRRAYLVPVLLPSKLAGQPSPPLIFIFRERKKEQQQQQMDFRDPAFANSSAHKNQTNQFKNHSQFSLLLFFKRKRVKNVVSTYIIHCILNFGGA